jgi:hypothetical protein
MGQQCLDSLLVDRLIERARSALHLNGSDVELISLADRDVTVAFSGRVVESMSAVMLLKIGMEIALKREVPGFRELKLEAPGSKTESPGDF